MTTERRDLSKDMMLVDNTGRTFVTRWLDQMESFGGSRSNVISIDGIMLDSDTLCALNDEGEALAPTKMSVRELRAELAARQYPLRGNKKELIKQLQVRSTFPERIRGSNTNVFHFLISLCRKLEARQIFKEEQQQLPNHRKRKRYEEEKFTLSDL